MSRAMGLAALRSTQSARCQIRMHGERTESYIDDARWTLVGWTIHATLFSRAFEEREAFLGEGEHSLEVQGEYLGPRVILSTQELMLVGYSIQCWTTAVGMVRADSDTDANMKTMKLAI